MDYQQVFDRYELKFILNSQQYEAVKQGLKWYMSMDQYGETTIQSIYYDTPSRLLVRRSLDKPLFKEKIRLRSYGLAKEDTDVFLEVKRKMGGLVYKRRIPIKESQAALFFQKEGQCGDGQIAREITSFRDMYGNLEPAMAIIYERTAYFQREGDLRVTFDKNIRFRSQDLNLHQTSKGELILPSDSILMEVKVSSSVPIWLARLLSQNGVYRTTISKYGAAYELQMKQQKGNRYKLWKTSLDQSLQAR